jgi:hypothetical protein
MNARVDRLFQEVRQLSTAEQEELMLRLDMALDDDLSPDDAVGGEENEGSIDPKLQALVRQRIAEAERGEAVFVSHEECMAELWRQLAER